MNSFFRVTPIIHDHERLIAAYVGENKTRIWDDGLGPLWVYRESQGVVGVVRAITHRDAWNCVIDEIMDDADPDLIPKEDDEELPEGIHFRGSGVPSNPHAKTPYAQEDLNGTRLDRLTLELAYELRINIEIEL